MKRLTQYIKKAVHPISEAEHVLSGRSPAGFNTPKMQNLTSYLPLYLLPSSFDFAFDLARASCKEKIPEIHLKHAIYLEDEVNPSRPAAHKHAVSEGRSADSDVL